MKLFFALLFCVSFCGCSEVLPPQKVAADHPGNSTLLVFVKRGEELVPTSKVSLISDDGRKFSADFDPTIEAYVLKTSKPIYDSTLVIRNEGWDTSVSTISVNAGVNKRVLTLK